MFGVDDPNGHVAHVSLCNYPTLFNASLSEMDAILAVGTVLAIREPTYKMTATGKGTTIKIDSPSDVVFFEDEVDILRDVKWASASALYNSLPLPSSMIAWKAKGAEEFRAGRWLSAAICYTRALKFDPESQVLLLNRAEIYLRLGWFNSSLSDVDKATKHGAISDAALARKALFRAVKANYYLRRYARVVDLAKTAPMHAECTEWGEKAKQRIKEESTGDYDWCSLFKAAQKPCARPDVADFHGCVEVREGTTTPGQRGVFTTRDVKLGELLVRMFAY